MLFRCRSAKQKGHPGNCGAAVFQVHLQKFYSMFLCVTNFQHFPSQEHCGPAQKAEFRLSAIGRKETITCCNKQGEPVSMCGIRENVFSLPLV